MPDLPSRTALLRPSARGLAFRPVLQPDDQPSARFPRTHVRRRFNVGDARVHSAQDPQPSTRRRAWMGRLQPPPTAIRLRQLVPARELSVYQNHIRVVLHNKGTTCGQQRPNAASLPEMWPLDPTRRAPRGRALCRSSGGEGGRIPVSSGQWAGER